MARRAYTIYVIPAAHKVAANVALALVNGDSTINSFAFSVAANPISNHEDPVTHYFGGMPTSEAWESQVGNLAENMPAASWPVQGNGNVAVTEQEAVDAAEAIHMTITITQDDSTPSPEVTLNNAMAALGLKRVEWPI